MPGLAARLLGARRIVGMGLERQRILEALRYDIAGRWRRAQGLGLADRLAIERQAGGQAHALVSPRRFRIPHVQIVEIHRPDAARERELELGIALDLLG